MEFRRGATLVGLVALVALAGCAGILGGSGTPTGAATTPGTIGASGPTGTPTVSPTPTATPTASPTATPLPAGFATRTVTNESLGTTFELTGEENTLQSVLTADVTGHRITRGGVLECARASPFVATSTNGSVADVRTTMSYDSSMLPPNATESELSVFVFNRTVEFYLELETTVDAENDTVTATSVLPGQSFSRESSNGSVETITPKLDGTRLDNAFVVMHYPTFWDGAQNREVPAYCASSG